jgi:hypothetical protein
MSVPRDLIDSPQVVVITELHASSIETRLHWHLPHELVRCDYQAYCITSIYKISCSGMDRCASFTEVAVRSGANVISQ